MHLVLCEEKSDVEKLLHRRDHVGRLTCLKSALLLRKLNSVKTCYLATSGHVHRAKKKKWYKLLFLLRQTTNSTTMTKDYMEKKSETPKTLVLTVSTFRTRTQTPRKNLIYTANKNLISL